MPFSCCDVFYGWADKLEHVSGRSWDLPCSCGLARFCSLVSSSPASKTFGEVATASPHTTGHNGDEVCCVSRTKKGAERWGTLCSPAYPASRNLPRNVPDDSNTYSSSALRELIKGNIGRDAAIAICRADHYIHHRSSSTSSSSGPEATINAACDEMVLRWEQARRPALRAAVASKKT